MTTRRSARVPSRTRPTPANGERMTTGLTFRKSLLQWHAEWKANKAASARGPAAEPREAN